MPTEIEDKDLILRDKLALSRTKLANQRTLLAYVRTGIYFTVTALGVAYIGENKGTFGWLEWILTSIGIVIVIFGIVNYFLVRKKIKQPGKF